MNRRTEPIDIIRRLSQPLTPREPGYRAKLEKLAEVRAVLFDVYGTLFISGSGDIGLGQGVDNSSALAAALEALNISGKLAEPGKTGADLLPAEIKKEHARLKNLGADYPEIDIREMWTLVLEELFPFRPGLDAEFVEKLATEYECRINPVWPMPGAEETLAALREKNILLGIVSNAQFHTPLLFEAFFGKTPEELGFEPELCAWSYRLRRAKPSLHAFGIILERLQARGISPEQVVHVGNDWLNDIHAAKQAGCRAALFAGDARSLRLRSADPRCEKTVPDAIIADLRQLPGLL